MGAWGVEAFDNDDANDWVAGVIEADDPNAVVDVLTECAQWPSDEELDYDLGMEALAAAEVVATAAGAPPPRNAHTEKVLAWAPRHPGLAAHRALAAQAVERVLAPDSELRETWLVDGADGNDVPDHEWVEAVHRLSQRLQP